MEVLRPNLPSSNNQLKQKLQHSSNLDHLKLRPRRSQLKQRRRPRPSQRHNSLQLSSSSSNSSLITTQPVTTPATTTELTITMEARTLTLAQEQVVLAARLRGQPSSEPQRIACVVRHLQEKTLILLIRWTGLRKAI